MTGLSREAITLQLYGSNQCCSCGTVLKAAKQNKTNSEAFFPCKHSNILKPALNLNALQGISVYEEVGCLLTKDLVVLIMI